MDAKLIWKNCLAFIKQHVSEQSFKTWFLPIVAHKFENKTLTLQVPNRFFYEWLEENYLPLLKQVIHQQIGIEGKLAYMIHTKAPLAKKTIQQPNGPTENTFSSHKPFSSSPSSTKTQQAPLDENKQSYLNANYTFYNFIEGSCNQLARSAAHAVAERPGATSFNPLMIYGRVGLGKTHLVQAIGNEIKEANPTHFVRYLSSEKFTHHLIEALRNNAIQSFINFYFEVDTLIIDDIQFLAKKEKTQEVFFHIFNHLHQTGKQIIMTSDKPPRTLEGLQERLLSRFKWGLTADLQLPDFETRVAIIQAKLERENISLEDSLIHYIAHSVDTNIRELEGVLVSLLARASLSKEAIDLQLIQDIMKNIVKEIETEVNIDYIQKVVAQQFKTSIDQIKSKSRKKEIAMARQVAMYLTKAYTDHSLKSIGKYFGGRDHSTVIHAIQVVNDTMDIDPAFKNRVEDVKKSIRVETT